MDELLPTLHSAQTFFLFTEEKKYHRKPEILRNFVSKVTDEKAASSSVGGGGGGGGSSIVTE